MFDLSFSFFEAGKKSALQRARRHTKCCCSNNNAHTKTRLAIAVTFVILLSHRTTRKASHLFKIYETNNFSTKHTVRHFMAAEMLCFGPEYTSCSCQRGSRNVRQVKLRCLTSRKPVVTAKRTSDFAKDYLLFCKLQAAMVCTGSHI